MNSAIVELKKKEVVQETIDRFRFEDFNRSELAIDLISTMLGFNMKDRHNEKHKDTPDPARLKELEDQRETLLSEQDLVYRGNKKIMDACVKNYGPIIRSRFA